MTIANRQRPAEEGIIDFSRKFNIDLVILSRTAPSFLKWNHPFFPLNQNRLLRKIRCPVLNIGSGQGIPPIKNIVLPIGEHFHVRKLLFATCLARPSHSTIHLVAAEGCEPAGSLHRSYRLLRENTDLPVECRSLHGVNLADMAWTYAKKIRADLILIQYGSESHLAAPLNAFSHRFLFNASRIPVLTVP